MQQNFDMYHLACLPIKRHIKFTSLVEGWRSQHPISRNYYLFKTFICYLHYHHYNKTWPFYKK